MIGGNIPPAPSLDAAQRTALRRLYLTLFLRGRGARGLSKSAAPTSIARKLGGILLLYTFVGAYATAFITSGVFALSIYLHAMTFLTVGMFIIGSAGEVLFNKDEGEILLHRPVAPRTLLWAKVRVLVEVAVLIAVALNLVGFVIGALRGERGWLFPVAHVATICCAALLCAGGVVITYQLCLRWFGRERLDSMLTIVQVLTAVVFILATQLVPRLMSSSAGAMHVDVDRWWIALLPPAWLAGIDDAVAGSGSTSSLLLGTVGVVVTVVVGWAALMRLGRSYGIALQVAGEQQGTVSAGRSGRLRRLVDAPPLRWWLRDPVERASFVLTTAYLVRDRETRLRIYPGLAPMLVFPFIGMFSARGGAVGPLSFMAGYLGIVPLAAAGMLQYSQHWQAADLFRVAPLTGPAAVCHGSRKAVLLFLAAPMYIIVSAVLMLFGGSEHLLVPLAGVITFPVYSLIPYAWKPAIPLSRPGEASKSTSRSLLVIPILLATFLVSGGAMFAFEFGWFPEFLVTETVVVVILTVLFARAIRRAKWPPME